MVRRYLLVAVALGVLLGPAGASRAAVSIGNSRVVVSARGAAAIADRDPFRLRIVAGSGVPALSEVVNRQPRPAILPPLIDPVSPGISAPKSGQLYAPVSYLVGQESIVQYSQGVWAGNLMSGERSGVEYSARIGAATTRAAGPGRNEC